MVNRLLTIVMILLGSTICIAQSTLLADGKAKLAAADPVAAEQLFQQIVEAQDSEAEAVEEALYWQLKIYSGDFLSSMLLLQPMQAAHPDDHPLKRQIAQQMGLSRWAFFVASGNYLNATVMESSLTNIKAKLPAMESGDVDMLLATLSNAEILGQLLADHENNPAGAEGLVQSTNQYCLYLAVSDSLPGLDGANVNRISNAVDGGVQFDQLQFLDWMARVALDLDKLLNEPNGPDLPDIQRRCDERIIKLAVNETNNRFAQEARKRLGR